MILSLEQQCNAAIDLLLRRHGWQLLSRDEFARRALDYLREGKANTPFRAAIHTYSLALHAACSGHEGAERQNRGYTELFRYLYDSAGSRYSNIREEVAQRALEQTFIAFEGCRTPGAFLAFAFQQLRDAARALRSQTSHESLPESLPDQQYADPARHMIAEELRLRFERLAAEFLLRYPRSAKQFAALRLKFIDGLDELTISQRLGKPIKSVYVLRARAIEKLRLEPEWRALASELGILSEE